MCGDLAHHQPTSRAHKTVKRDNIDLRPRDTIDLQGFIWVAGSDEYD
jgi:hypothetical protein